MNESLEARLGEIEDQGYTLLRGYLDRAITAEVRAHMDTLIGPVGSTGTTRNDLRHPIPGAIMARLASHAPTQALARALLGGAPRLRMREQVLIRSDPESPPWADELGYHIDAAFQVREFEAVPKQVYFQMLHYCSDVGPGGAAVHIVPGSHRHSYEQVFGEGSQQQERPIESNTSGVGHLEDGVEICADEGDLIVFNPLCFHAASPNRTQQPRYAYFTSYYDTGATRLIEFVRRTGYRDGFPDSLRHGLPEELRTILDH
jgi:hypothetical protein